jgi:hypothetical protein
MNKRERSTREIIGGSIGFLVISCIYGVYLYIYENAPVIYIIKEIVVFTASVVGITFIGLVIFFLLAFAWTKIKKKK